MIFSAKVDEVLLRAGCKRVRFGPCHMMESFKQGFPFLD
jgi:hypothetical protein